MSDTARDVIARALRDDFGPFGPRAPSVYADSLIEALHTAGYRILAPGELDSESLEAAAAKAKNWLEDWGEDLQDTCDAYRDAAISGSMNRRRIPHDMAKASARQFKERAEAVYDCGEQVAAAIRSLKGGRNA